MDRGLWITARSAAGRKITRTMTSTECRMLPRTSPAAPEFLRARESDVAHSIPLRLGHLTVRLQGR